MTQMEIKRAIFESLARKTESRVFFRYEREYRYFIPLMMSETLFLGTEEDDFLLDGYSVRRFRDVKKAESREDMCNEILKREGILDGIEIPDVNLFSWETVFRSLQKRGKNIIVEKESMDERKCDFVIGRIETVFENYAYVRHFDADGAWESEPCRIPYSGITSVTFESRYVTIFSKYLGALPDNFGRLA